MVKGATISEVPTRGNGSAQGCPEWRTMEHHTSTSRVLHSTRTMREYYLPLTVRPYQTQVSRAGKQSMPRGEENLKLVKFSHRKPADDINKYIEDGAPFESMCNRLEPLVSRLFDRPTPRRIEQPQDNNPQPQRKCTQ